jgi:hypothetical protein
LAVSFRTDSTSADAEINAAICATRNWLLRLAAAFQHGDFSERMLQCLLGLWICSLDPNSSEHDDNPQITKLLLERIASAHESQIVGCDSKLLLLCLHIVRAREHTADGLEKFALRLSRAMTADKSACNEHIGEAVLLFGLGLNDAPLPGELRVPIAPERPPDLLHLDADGVRQLCAEVCAATHFGTLQSSCIRHRRDFEYAIKVLLVDALRIYDISTGAVLLRAAAYLNLADDPVVKDASSFLRLQQLADGRFGHYGMQVEELRGAGLDVDLDLYLPLTASCIWALVEIADPQLRVFSLPRRDPSRSDAR